MSLLEQIVLDMHMAQKSGEKIKLEVLRLIKSEAKYKEIEKGSPLTEEEIVSVLSSAVKKRKEAIEQFRRGNRVDLVEKEEKELQIISSYLPAQLSEEELARLVEETISEVGASSKADVGKVMKVLMPKVKGKADGKIVNALVTTKLP